MLYQKRILSVLVRFIVLLILYQFGRLSFLLINHSYYSATTSSQIVTVFYRGMLFDMSAICNISFVLFIAYLIPFPFIFRKQYIKVLDVLFVVLLFLQMLFNFIDCEYFKFINKRTTFDIIKNLFLSTDAIILLPRFLFDFWFIPLFWIIISSLGIWLIRLGDEQIEKIPHTKQKRWFLWAIPQFLFVVALLIVGIRGVGFKPIQLITASKFTNTANFPLIYNTPFTILHTMKGDALKQEYYFNDKKASSIFNPTCQYYKGGETKKENVVIIILESFSFDYIGSLSHTKGFTPFLDSIIGQSLAFDNAFANGKKSIEALPSIFASIPNLLEEPYITSQYGSNTIKGLPSILHEQGYTTSFFHGGRNGTMGFDNFCKAAGMEHYYGMNEYVGPDAYDGDWGIRDEEFLQFYAKQLQTFHQPFFSSVFTLSSHHPYTVPDKYKSRFKEGKMPIYKAIQYADYSLQQFFKIISKESWFKNTIFVFTADHAAQEEDYSHKKYADLFRIPIIFYHPGDTKMKKMSHQVVQHADIMPTILDYLNIKGSYLCFGKSVLDTSTQRMAVEYLGGVYSIFEDNYSMSFDGNRFMEKTTLHDTLKTDMPKTVDLQMQLSLKSIIQQFNDRLMTNKMTITN
jgi:phosphoglycerol transferase MdoB-like AlkP superfamily enzyme